MATQQFCLNMARTDFADADIEVKVHPYIDEASLRALRRESRGTQVVKRVSATDVWEIPLVPDYSGGDRKSIKLSENLSTVATLMREATLRHIVSLDRRVIGFRPLTFLADDRNDFLVAATGARISGVSVRPVYELEYRVLHFDEIPPFVGLFINVRTTRLVDVDCARLLREGFNLRGLYVSRRLKFDDSRISPKNQLIGRVARIEGDMLYLENARDGFESVAAEQAYVDPDHIGFPALISHFMGTMATNILGQISQKAFQFSGGKGRYRIIRGVFEYFRKVELELVRDVSFTIGELTENGELLKKLQTSPRPTYVFNSSGIQSAQEHWQGIDKFGPYSRQTFTPTRPRVCVICQKRRKGQVEQFVHKLLNGVRGSGRAEPFASGLIGKYRLESCAPEFFLAEDATAASYRKAAIDAVRSASAQNQRWDLALVEIEERFRQLPNQENPYFVTKAAFLTQGIAVQEFEAETVAFVGRQLAYTLNNMALATYAKLGGVPWLLQANPTIAHELVVGLGSSAIGGSKVGRRERVVGVTTVFSGDGNYRVATLSRAVPIEQYRNALLDSLRDTVSRLSVSLNWKPGEHVRLVFHAFKPMKDDEAAAVVALMSDMSNFDVEYAFVHIEQDHPYLLFDKSQQGLNTGRGNKGEYSPQRGVFLRLSEREVLLTLVGPREIKRAEHGMPRPVLMRLHRSSTFLDTTYLARQAFAFASHSWRSFFMAEMPVTIGHSQLVARMLGNLGEMPNWNSDVMIGRIGNTRWFL